jgi:GT2 family glycosyltransferase
VKSSDKVSIVIPTHNGVEHIPPCLDSLKKQARRADEIIVVDDASTDETASLIARSYPDVRLICLERNRGFAGAVNEGIRRASGEYIALLNDDTQAHPQWLTELVKVLDGQADISFCSSKMLFADQPELINSIGIGFTRAGIAMDVGLRQKDGPEFNRPRPIFGACAGAAIYRRRLFDEIGLFDEDLFMWYEDVDFSFRAQLAGHTCLYVPTAVVYHKGGGTVSSNERKHIYYCCRNQVLVLVKNLPRALLPHYMLRISWVCMKHSIKSLLKGETAVLAGYSGTLTSLSHFLKKRNASAFKSVTSISHLLEAMQMDSDKILLPRSEKMKSSQ